MINFIHALGIDANDLRIIFSALIIIVVVFLALILFGAVVGLAVNVFEEMRGL